MTPESLRELKNAYQSGMKYRDMAKEFGVRQATIAYHVKKWGLTRKHDPPPVDEILVKEYLGNHLSTPEIAKKYGATQSVIHKHLARLGINRNRSEAREVFRQRILKETGLPYILDTQGYPRDRVPEGFQTTERVNGGMARLHDIEMEKFLGRPIGKGELIHHINFDKMDNRIENLHLCKCRREHFLFHRSLEGAVGVLIKAGVVDFEPVRGYFINEEKLEEYLASTA